METAMAWMAAAAIAALAGSLGACLWRLRRQRTRLAAIDCELEETRLAAETARRGTSQFFSNMSHEIRTPMTSILGFADILLSQATNDEARDAARTVQRNGEYLLGVLNDVLDLTKLDAGAVQVESSPVDVAKLAGEVLRILRPRAEAKGLSLRVSFRTPIPQTVFIDPTRLRQILIHLIGNAIKFTDRGWICLEVGADDVKPTAHGATSEAKRARLTFAIIDTGIGIGEETLAGLFHPFAQADSSTTRRFAGAGLGLAICRRLANLLGGDVVATSRPGQGSTFTLEFAATIAGDVARNLPLAAPAHAPREDSLPRPANELSSKRILLAEDGPDNQRLVSYFLAKAGAAVTIVDNGRLAVEGALAARESGQPFDVILMDMQMPVLDGYRATQELRSAGYFGRIVALTASAMDDDRRLCLDAGCDDYASKPIVRDELYRIVLGAPHRLAAPVASVHFLDARKATRSASC